MKNLIMVVLMALPVVILMACGSEEGLDYCNCGGDPTPYPIGMCELISMDQVPTSEAYCGTKNNMIPVYLMQYECTMEDSGETSTWSITRQCPVYRPARDEFVYEDETQYENWCNI